MIRTSRHVIQVIAAAVGNSAWAIRSIVRTMRRSWVTPVLSAVIFYSSGAGAMPLISEVYYDAEGADNGQTFVEIFGEPGSSVDGLFLEGVNGANGNLGPTIALVGIFGLDGIFVLADDLGDATSDVLNADQIANFDFQNGPDSVVLRDAEEIIDSVGYGVFDIDEIFAGEGSPAPDAPPGSSLARAFADVDTDDNQLDFEIHAVPSPGSVELLPVPEPQPIALLTLGLLALSGSRQAGSRQAGSRQAGSRQASSRQARSRHPAASPD